MITFLFFADDWGRHPSSAQYLARELARDYQVLWINTIGMRRPRLDLYTLKRGLEKLRQWLTRSSPRVELKLKLRVLNPALFPDWRSPLIQRFNVRSITSLVKRYTSETNNMLIGVTALPLPADWLDGIPVKGWIYYCVDNFADWPGLDGQTLRNCELATVTRARLIIAASLMLQHHVQTYGRMSKLLTHGIDLEAWIPSDQANPDDCQLTVRKPRAVWWGLLDERLDWDWIFYAASRLPEVQFLLVGPVQYRPASVTRYRNITIPGPVSVTCLPAIARQSDVLIMPYVESEVTRAMQPLKLLEYLATGKPIVARRLPALERWHNFLGLCDSKEEFVSHTASAIREPLSRTQFLARLRILEQETWSAKAKQLLEWLQRSQLISINCGAVA